jgi:hypothetical protein
MVNKPSHSASARGQSHTVVFQLLLATELRILVCCWRAGSGAGKEDSSAEWKGDGGDALLGSRQSAVGLAEDFVHAAT